MKARLAEWVIERLVWIAGCLILLMVVAIGFYLGSESRYAFQRTFPFGFRVGLQPLEADANEDISFDPNATFVGDHIDGVDGPDDKDSALMMPSLHEMVGVSSVATGTPTSFPDDPHHPMFFRDSYQAPKRADQGEKFIIYGFATPEYKGDKIRLRWAPDSGFIAQSSPYDLRLELLRAPQGVRVQPFSIDLREHPSGSIELPAWISRTDEERIQGYQFQLRAVPRQSNVTATLAGAMGSTWEPTHPYARFGFLPLILGTLLITIIALALAAPLAVWTALYLSEAASPRVREWFKPFIELLASVPTVVLGYFGLMLLAPGLMKVFGEAGGMTSGRSLLTAALMMAVLILPLMVSVAEDALRAVPGTLRDGALALGLSGSETINRVLLPAARPGLIAAVLLGFARAVGETMIIWILAGGSATLPSLVQPVKSLLQPSKGVTDTIASEMGNVVFEGPHYGHLFLIGLVLFLITLTINLVGYYYGRRSWQV
jgi:phosphate transport system permease protein